MIGVVWISSKTGELHRLAGFQSYRIADGKLVGSAWPYSVEQEHLINKRPQPNDSQ